MRIQKLNSKKLILIVLLVFPIIFFIIQDHIFSYVASNIINWKYNDYNYNNNETFVRYNYFEPVLLDISYNNTPIYYATFSIPMYTNTSNLIEIWVFIVNTLHPNIRKAKHQTDYIYTKPDYNNSLINCIFDNNVITNAENILLPNWHDMYFVIKCKYNMINNI